MSMMNLVIAVGVMEDEGFAVFLTAKPRRWD